MSQRISISSGVVAIEALGDVALLLRFEERIDAAINARVHAAARALRTAWLPGVVDLVPAYATLTLVLDEQADDALDTLAVRVREVLASNQDAQSERVARLVSIPVAYGGEHGPDLAIVAAHAHIDEAEVVRRHAGVEYTVAMLGFLPGFPYLLGLDRTIALPRRASPRVRVPAGSVAIGSAQTGVYPCAAPGGWHLIGHTSARLFDASLEQPALLAPGDRVRFVPVPAGQIDAARVGIEQDAGPA